ncbi:MAG: Gfo/Idh/MocA family oxidoreductase [Trueperaceae bacterium]|nr:MAG: Gfo/Idh/MocA family oxidoreductase [Trueperaceae bacterium]
MKRYALVGTGSRAGLYLDALATTYRDACTLVGLCDLSQTRMDWHNRRLKERYGLEPLPAYSASAFDRMIFETRPDTVIVTTVDATHHHYIVRAMDLGCDVITEKPMTTDIDKTRAIFEAIERTGQSLKVTFNYRYAPAYARVRELIAQGVVGKPLSVDFSWLLDTSHGADYFRRWHREKQHSGGLSVHKATHHFDLINWWVGSIPKEVFALGDLLFYGGANAEARGESYPYHRYTDEPAAAGDPFALLLDQNESLKGLYLDAEAETGYLRDRNVFGESITIEDVLCVTARYRSGALLSYHLVAFCPWEGMRVAITGDKGRVELEVIESVEQVEVDQAELDVSASKSGFKRSRLTVFPMFAPPYEVSIPAAEGGHGGADPLMLEQLFSPSPPEDPLERAASHLAGAASILLGIAANRSLETRSLVRVDELLQL